MQLKEAGDHFRQSDVTFWGIVALACGALAIVAVNVSAFVPASVFTALHASRVGGGLEQVRGELAEMRREAALIRRENVTLSSRFNLAEQQSGEAARRIGALEVSVPRLLEAIPPQVEIDRSAITAAIIEDDWMSLPAEGGAVRVRRQTLPLLGIDPDTPAALAQPLPPELLNVPENETPPAEGLDDVPGNADEFAALEPFPAGEGEMRAAPGSLLPASKPAAGPQMAIALSIHADQGNAVDAWKDYQSKLGSLLLGLQPSFGTNSAGAPRIVAGPLPGEDEARALCARLKQVNIDCEAVPYAGVPLPG